MNVKYKDRDRHLFQEKKCLSPFISLTFILAKFILSNQESINYPGKDEKKMKKWVFVLILPFFAISFYLANLEILEGTEKAQQREQVFPVAQEIDKLISSALEEFEKGKADKAAGFLLDAVLLSRPRQAMPKGFEEKVMGAKEQFSKGNFEQGVEMTTEAYQIFKTAAQSPMAGQEKKSKAQKKEEIAPLAETVKKRILLARQKFQEGNADQGVLLLLEAIQLTSPG